MRVLAVLVAVALALGVLLLGSSPADAIVVWPGDMRGWVFVEETPTGSGELVAGPDTPPLGAGSARLTLADTTGGMALILPGYGGTRLDQITRLEYSTYQAPTSTSTVQAISLQFNIDDDLTDGDDGWKGRLVFEPYYTETVLKGVWQTWDPMTGLWWGTSAPISTACPISSPCTWGDLLSLFPNAGIHNVFGAVILKAGSGWPAGFDGNVDALTIGVGGSDVTYNFELTLPVGGTVELITGGPDQATAEGPRPAGPLPLALVAFGAAGAIGLGAGAWYARRWLR